jgi:hypothetical protein
MADEVVEAGDKAIVPPSVDNDGSSAKAGMDDSGKKPDDVSTLKNSYVEAQRKISEQGNELARLRAEMDGIKGTKDIELANALKSLGESIKPKPEARPDMGQWAESLAKKHDVDAELVKEILSTSSGWIGETERLTEDKIQQLSKKLESKLAELDEKAEKLDPDYISNKEWVDRLTASGMGLKQAKAVAKDITSKIKPATPSRIPPPVNLSDGRAGDGSKKAKKYLSDEDRMKFKVEMGLTDQDLDSMENEYQRNRDAEDRKAKDNE